MNKIASLKMLATATIIASSLATNACGGSQDTTADSNANSNKTSNIDNNIDVSSDVDPVIARQVTMSEWHNAMGVMADMMEKPEDFDLAKFQNEAAFIAEHSDTPWQHFTNKDADIGGATESIKSDSEGFASQIEMFKAVSAGLTSTAQSAQGIDDVKTSFEAVAASCHSCHQTYRAQH